MPSPEQLEELKKLIPEVATPETTLAVINGKPISAKDLVGELEKMPRQDIASLIEDLKILDKPSIVFPKKEPIQLWVGLAHEVDHHAKKLGFQNPIIVSRFEQLLGYHGQLTVHFCGNWWKLSDASAIRQRIQHLRDAGDRITSVNH